MLPRSNGDFRLGAEKFRKKLRFSLASDLSMEEIMKRARADLAATQAAIYETALPLYKKYFPDADPSSFADKKKVTDRGARQAGGAASERRHDCRLRRKDAGARRPRFTKGKDLITVFDKPLQIIVMPEFKRGQGIAYCDSPGPLEKNGETFYAIEPTPATWSKERKESFFREYNNYMVHDLTVHEAMPGHFLQLAHANRSRRPPWCGRFSAAAPSSKAGPSTREHSWPKPATADRK